MQDCFVVEKSFTLQPRRHRMAVTPSYAKMYPLSLPPVSELVFVLSSYETYQAHFPVLS